jgi:cytochrome P450
MQRELAPMLCAGAPAFGALRDLGYCSQVISESLRLFPPAWMMARRAREDDELNGHHIPKGSHVYFSPYAVHRDPRYWNNPEGFDPDRFSLEAQEAAKKSGRPRYAYFPFSGGQRQCIGDHFARMEALAILSVLVSRYNFALLPGQRVTPEPSVTLRPRGGLQVTISAA